jgi:hypothetical protein
LVAPLKLNSKWSYGAVLGSLEGVGGEGVHKLCLCIPPFWIPPGPKMVPKGGCIMMQPSVVRSEGGLWAVLAHSGRPPASITPVSRIQMCPAQHHSGPSFNKHATNSFLLRALLNSQTFRLNSHKLSAAELSAAELPVCVISAAELSAAETSKPFC